MALLDMTEKTLGINETPAQSTYHQLIGYSTGWRDRRPSKERRSGGQEIREGKGVEIRSGSRGGDRFPGLTLALSISPKPQAAEKQSRAVLGRVCCNPSRHQGVLKSSCEMCPAWVSVSPWRIFGLRKGLFRLTPCLVLCSPYNMS